RAVAVTGALAATLPAVPVPVTFPSPLIIGGTGFKLGTALAPVRAGILVVGSLNRVTVNSGTILESYSLGNSLNHGISIANAVGAGGVGNPTYFTNNGTINILGESLRSGITAGITSTANLQDMKINIVNDGIINVDLACLTPSVTNPTGFVWTGQAAYQQQQSNFANITGVFITNNGTLTLKNPSTIALTGYAIWGSGGGQRLKTTFTNNGTFNLDGSINSIAQGFTLINSGIVNTNNSLAGFPGVTNNSTGSINFTKSPANFTVLIGAAATADATYTDGNLNVYTIRTTKVTGAGLQILAASAPNTTVPAIGTLTLVSGSGDATIDYSAVTAITTNAISSTTTNSGTINTGQGGGVNLNAITSVTLTLNATSVIAPGGSSGKGITNFARAATTITGKLVLQVSGNTAAGIDYDQVTSTTALGSFNISGATLDITGIYTPAGPVTIEILKTNATGSLTGSFASVIGLTTGWSLVYTNATPGKVELVYAATSPTANLWIGATDTSWTNAGNWSAGIPDQNSDVSIVPAPNAPVITGNVNINSLSIVSTSLTVNSGSNLTVTGAITNTGTMTLASNANLIQSGTTNTNTGNITVNRNSNLLNRFDYTIWSSPTTNAALFLKTFSPATLDTRFYNYDEPSNLYSVIASPTTTPFTTGAGYLIRMPDTDAGYPSAITYAGAFTGVPNNGDISKSITNNGVTYGYNMIGNPYPSTIDAQAFITANTANIESSLYFWRKINAAAGSAYAVYNPMGSTSATPSSALPNGNIQVGQGFFVKAKTGATTVSFNNAMRVANNQNQFFKTKSVVDKNRVWLNLTNTSGAFSQVLVGYTTDAIQGIDIFDAKYFNDSSIALTSNINNEEYTIQGRPTFDASDVVALNFKTDVAGDYTIALDHFDGLFSTGQDIYLKDNKTGTETDLKIAVYNFTAVAGVDNTRFSLKYQKTLKVDAPAFNENSVRVYKNNGTLYVNSGNIAINNIKVFDIQGRLIIEQKNVKANSTTIKDSKATNQVFIVKIVGEDNSIVTKKVLN
uniref:T9SS sorting signal type C domain-containing protein n=1 Tax=Flavobacterium sp. TaxID=239 RepID=UPI00286BA52C